MATSLLELSYINIKLEDSFVVKTTKPRPDQAEKITELATRESERKGLSCCSSASSFHSDGASVWTPVHALDIYS